MTISLVLLTFFVVVNYIISICSKSINADASYYFSVVRLMMDGKTPFVDYNIAYTPLSFYIMSIPLSIFGLSYEIGMLTLLLINLTNSYWLYKICIKISHSIRLSWLGALMLLLYGLIFEGDFYVLEPFVLFFGLPAVYLLFDTKRWTLVLSGFLCFCAYWCKQYGFGFLILAMLFVMVQDGFNKDSIKKELNLIVGFIIGAALFVTILLIQKVPISSLFVLSGSSYQQYGGINGIISRYVFSFKMIPVILLSIVAFFVNFNETKKNPLIIMSIFGIFGFMLQFYFRPYRHYFLLALPFYVLLIISQVPYLKKEYRIVYVGLTCLMLAIPAYFTSKNGTDILKQQPRFKQWQISNMSAAVIKPGSYDVFASKEMIPITLLNNYTPPCLKKYGLSGGFVRTDEKTLEMIENAQYCLISKQDFDKNDFNVFSDKVKEYLYTNFDIETFVSFDNNSYFVFKRNEEQK